MSNETMKLKYRGCLLGGLIGDCIGAPFEGLYLVKKEKLNKFFNQIFESNTESNPNIVPIYAGYTDDTAMSKCIAESMIQHKCFNAKDMVLKFTNEYFNDSKTFNRGYGRHIQDIFLEWKSNDYSDIYGPAKRQFYGAGSLGNGAAMRIAPIALYGTTMSECDLIDLVRNTAILTHTHPHAINGAILQCLAITSALTVTRDGKILDFDANKFLDSLIEKMEPIEMSSKEIKKNEGYGWLVYKSGMNPESESRTPYKDKLLRMKHILLSGKIQTSEEVAIEFGNSVAALGSVPTAIYSVIRAHSNILDFNVSKNGKIENSIFLKTLFDSISFGGDTDTIATMACAIAGAMYGEDAMISILKSQCASYQYIEELADKMFDVTFPASSL